MTLPCPHCGAPLAARDRDIGERVLHPRCGGWILVARRADGSVYGGRVSKVIQKGE
jgi:hypothetical protein